MRKIYLFMMVSVDGYFEGANHDISWHNVDEEFVQFANEQLDESETLIFGRRTYELMADFWPSKQVEKTDQETARRMNTMHKLVFSKSLATSTWNNVEIHAGALTSVLHAAKKSAKKDLAVLGSSNLSVSLFQEKLLDEVRIMVNPVVLGQGTSLFHGLQHSQNLHLQKTRAFKSGNILNYYKVVY